MSGFVSGVPVFSAGATGEAAGRSCRRSRRLMHALPYVQHGRPDPIASESDNAEQDHRQHETSAFFRGLLLFFDDPRNRPYGRFHGIRVRIRSGGERSGRLSGRASSSRHSLRLLRGTSLPLHPDSQGHGSSSGRPTIRGKSGIAGTDPSPSARVITVESPG